MSIFPFIGYPLGMTQRPVDVSNMASRPPLANYISNQYLSAEIPR
jgi:hypothetical protein